MSIKSVLKNYYQLLCHAKYVNDISQSVSARAAKCESEIVRNVHSIEKGLSLEKPRSFFGIAKIHEMCSLTKEYNTMPDKRTSVIWMVIDALEAYLKFHRENLNDSRIKTVSEQLEQIKTFTEKPSDRAYGGVLHVRTSTDEAVYQHFKKLVEARHSVRDFSGEAVPMEKLRKAIEIALRAPSACNRQGVRAYIITGDNKQYLSKWLAGVGGFADSVDKFIMITGKISAYRSEEQFQYVVSASIFAGYLSLALQSVGIGGCLIQRPLLRGKKWNELSEHFQIPRDEQIVIMLGIGMLKEEYNVPVSNRFTYEEQVREI